MLAILGGGITGLSVAHFYRNEYKIFEKQKQPGGLCNTIKKNQFLFDYTGHLLHFTEIWTKNLVENLLKNNLNTHFRNAWIFSSEVYTPYPFQKNTYGLPKGVIQECLNGLIKAKTSMKDSNNFYDWTINRFGVGIAKYFMIPYNEKLWTTNLKHITTEWMGRFVPDVSVEEFVEGTKRVRRDISGYNPQFYYPSRGGIASLIEALTEKKKQNIKLGKNVVSIDIENKKIYFEDGSIEYYDNMVSTIPLPILIRKIKDVPKQIRDMSSGLIHNSVYNINFGIDRENISDKHWIYFPEKTFPFYRLGFTSNFSENMTPQSTTSIYVEIAHSLFKGIDKQKTKFDTIKSLKHLGIIKSENEIICDVPLDIEYAYVIYDKNRTEFVNKIQSYLRKNGIYSIGRFGAWEYSSMEDSIKEGKKIAEMLNEQATQSRINNSTQN
jgi:protoporphyrinogen oxidase